MFLCSGKKLLLFGISALLIVSLSLGLYFGLRGSTAISKNPYVGGVVTNGYECAPIGADILEKGGSAVDAAIAALFCEGVAMPQSMGLGGGFFMVIYNRETKTAETLNAREMAPISASENMYNGNGSLAFKGGLSVAVPGELRGYWMAHRKYGKLPWAEIIQPTIELCKEGHLVTKKLASIFKSNEKQLLNNPSLREIYIDPASNETYKEGHKLKRPKLAETLEIIAKEGGNALYNGSLAKKFVNDIKNMKGIISETDLLYYDAVWEKPVSGKLPFNQTLYTVSLPASGILLTFIFHTLGGFLDIENPNTVTNWQRIVESFKYAYAKRTELGDPEYVAVITSLVANLTSLPYAEAIRAMITDYKTFDNAEHYGANTSQVDDHGTAHISVLAANGDAVSVTSTINQYFGAGFRSVSTGIILNDEMDDFSAPNITNHFGVPPSPANYIAARKRPLSSMCPSIIVDEDGNVLLVIGAAGGTKITTSTALVAIKALWFNESLVDAIAEPRLHHQLFPMDVQAEYNFDTEILRGLREIGHNITLSPAGNAFAAVTAIGKINGVVNGSSDPRRGGQLALISRTPNI